MPDTETTTEAKAGHTPGPWQAHQVTSGSVVIEVAGAGREQQAIALISTPLHIGLARWQANACLIAAAPDLLAALTALLAKHDDRDGLSDLWPREAAAARAAIAKAGG